MTPVVHRFDWPDRFVVGTVGVPGARTFYLQAAAGDPVVSVALEKQECAALAQGVEEVLDQLMADDNRFSIPARPADELIDRDPLAQPVREEFRVGALTLGWDESTAQVVIEAFPMLEEVADATGLEEIEPEEMLLVRIPVGTARAFSQRTRDVVGAGRPLCPLCDQPMDTATDHICTLPDGFA